MQELTIKQKLSNYYYFVIFNSILACVIGVGYWLGRDPYLYLCKPELTDWLAIIYIVSIHFIILILMSGIAGGIVLPTIYLSEKKSLVIQSVIVSIFLGVLYTDVRVFQGGLLHILNVSTTTAINIFTSDTLMFTPNKITAYICLLIFLGIIHKFNIWVHKTNWFKNNNIGKKFIVLLVVFTIISQLIYHTANKDRKQQLLAYIQYLPLCANNNKIANKIHSTYKNIKTAKLQYPLQPLQTTMITNPPNILIIAMDAWRADCFNAKDSPNLWGFAQQGQIFTKHKSAASHTFGGLFGLFYGIPASYYFNFLYQQQPSLLFTRLKQLSYQINCFASNNYQDEYLKLFTNINTLYIFKSNINRRYKKDEQITKDWLVWYNNLNKRKPWFSFIFYDSLHGPDFPDKYSTIAKPAGNLYDYKRFANKHGKDNFITSYKAALNYIDSLAKNILQHLKNSNDLENTIVIITADHGCEFNDNNQNHWGYSSNFTTCQMQVPFAIIIPKKFQEYTIQHDNLTTHYDVMPTLLYNFLGVNNNTADYSIGNNLLDNNNKQDWYLATRCCWYGAYISAIIEKNKTLRINYNSNYYLLDNFNRLLLNKQINQQHLNQALEYMTRFIKK